MIFQNPSPESSDPGITEPATLATSPRLPECPRHGYDRPEAECYGDAGCPEWEVCRDCMGLGTDRDFPNLPCATCEGSGEVEVIVAIGKLIPREVTVSSELL